MLIHNDASLIFFAVWNSKTYQKEAPTYSQHSTFKVPLRHVYKNREFPLHIENFTGEFEEEIDRQTKL